jgi:hypothetical protein
VTVTTQLGIGKEPVRELDLLTDVQGTFLLCAGIHDSCNATAQEAAQKEETHGYR